VIGLLALVNHFVAVDNAWLHGSSSSSSDTPSFTSSSPATSSGLVGRWCVRTGYTQFNADGSFYDSAAGSGTWQDMSGGRINLTAGGQTLAATYRVSGNVMDMRTMNGADVRYTRC
jgi:hypothetical protein